MWQVRVRWSNQANLSGTSSETGKTETSLETHSRLSHTRGSALTDNKVKRFTDFSSIWQRWGQVMLYICVFLKGQNFKLGILELFEIFLNMYNHWTGWGLLTEPMDEWLISDLVFIFCPGICLSGWSHNLPSEDLQIKTNFFSVEVNVTVGGVTVILARRHWSGFRWG